MAETSVSLSRPVRVGLTNLDTSHPGAFVEQLRGLGYEIVAVCDDAGVHPSGYAASFATTHGIATVCADVAELAAQVDVAYVGGCAWSRRLEVAGLLARAGVGVLLDKPAAATLGDLDRLEELEWSGARIAGGSALGWCPELTAWARAGEGYADTAWAAAAGHALDYAVHAASLVCRAMGPGLVSVRATAPAAGMRQVLGTWADGRMGGYILSAHDAQPGFALSVVRAGRSDVLAPAFETLYSAMLAAVMPYLAGRGVAPLPLAQQLDTERLVIAAEWALRQGREISLDEVPTTARPFDQGAFTRSYAATHLGV